MSSHPPPVSSFHPDDSVIKAAAPEGPEADIYRDYWALQYERVAQHENSRIQVSSFVLAGSLVALGFITNSTVDNSSRVLAACAVLAVNLLAVVFASKERFWVKVHQDRAEAVLHALSENLFEAQAKVSERHYIKANSFLRHDPFRSALVLSYMHVVVGVLAVILASR